MGLGPPVCDKCWVIGRLTLKDDLNYGIKVPYGYSYWHCPICNNPELNAHLWELEPYQIAIVDDNERFLSYIQENLRNE